MNTIRIWLGHESLDVTLAYLKGKDAESEEAQERANKQQPGVVRRRCRCTQSPSYAAAL